MSASDHVTTDRVPGSVNFFSSEDYLASVAEAYYPGRAYELTDYDVAGATYRLLRICPRGLAREHVVTWVPFLDLLEPIAGRGRRGPSYLPNASHGLLTVEAWKARGEEKGLSVSPLIDFTPFATWDAYVAHAKTLGGTAFAGSRAKALKKLEAKHGLAFTWNDEAPDALGHIIQWKSRQYQESGFVDGFQSRSLVRVFELLRARGRLIVSTMRLGGTLVAGHAGVEYDGRVYYWLPAYDPAWAKQSVGAHLVEWMMEQSYQRRNREFDFLLGNEPYKWGYATHTRLVGPVGQKPLTQRVWKPLRERMVTEVRKHEKAYRGLQELKRRAQSLSLRLRGR